MAKSAVGGYRKHRLGGKRNVGYGQLQSNPVSNEASRMSRKIQTPGHQMHPGKGARGGKASQSIGGPALASVLENMRGHADKHMSARLRSAFVGAAAHDKQTIRANIKRMAGPAPFSVDYEKFAPAAG